MSEQTVEKVRTGPPLPDSLTRRQPPDTRLYAEALQNAERVEELRDHHGLPYAWMLWPSRNTWPTWHVNRPAATPGCACAPCHRPRCCNTWAEPVVLLTGETVAWVCPTCVEPVLPPTQRDGEASA